MYFWNLFVYISFSFRGPCVRKLLTGLIMYIYPLKIKTIVLYCIVLYCTFWSYLLLATYFSSSTLYMYLIQIFRSISSILSLEAINLCPFSHDITSAILVSNTNPVGVELFSYLNIFPSWQHEGKHSIVVKHKIESRAKQIKTKTYTQNQQNLMGTHTKCDWSFAI